MYSLTHVYVLKQQCSLTRICIKARDVLLSFFVSHGDTIIVRCLKRYHGYKFLNITH
jgi:hypothetical protein